MGHQTYVLLCTETTFSNPPVVFPKSSCNVQLLRRPCIIYHEGTETTVCPNILMQTGHPVES